VTILTTYVVLNERQVFIQRLQNSLLN